MKFDALVFDPDARAWLQFSSPRQVLAATSVGEVLAVIRQVESAAEAGRYAVGFVSYEAAPAFDRALTVSSSGQVPLALFGVFDAPVPAAPPSGDDRVALAPGIAEERHCQAVVRIRTYLAAGDTYQVNLTYPMTGEFAGDVTGLFASLYRAQPSPYAMMIEMDDFALCSVSPELFFELDGDHIRTEPMKGTRTRGRYLEEDQALQQALRASAKDKAENLMIVDMIRNDLGRIARPGSVRVDSLFTLRQLPTVWQQVSSVSARTDAGLTEIFRALFPCASVTGAPRVRTMEIIRELEDAPRGVYTGAVGIVKPGRQARFAVAIRTLMLDGQQVSYGVGGGIVWDSDPAEEWQESIAKAAVLRHRRPSFDLLETMRYDPGEGVFLLEYHLRRLTESANYFDSPLDLVAIREKLCAIQSDSVLRLRLLVGSDGGVVLEQLPLPVAVAGPVTLRLAVAPVDSSDPFLFHKTTSRRIYEEARSAIADCHDVVLFNELGELTETTISNLYLEIDGQLLTPARASGLLAGTYRQMMLDQGKAREARLLTEDLQRADRLFVSNSVRGLSAATLLQ